MFYQFAAFKQFKMATKVIPNNCVSEVKIPRRVRSANGVDYNPVLDLYATFNWDKEGVSLWNPVSGKVIAELRGFGVEFSDALFVPGNRIAVSSSGIRPADLYVRANIKIFDLGKVISNSTEFVKGDDDNGTDDEQDEDELDSTAAELVIEGKDILMSDRPGQKHYFWPGPIALSPGKNLLVADTFGCVGLYEIFIDWDNLKVLKSREVFSEEEENEIYLLCCSPDFKVTFFSYLPIISTLKVCLNTKKEAEIQDQDNITYYMLNGEEKWINGGVTGLVHDGENLIIANEGEIVLLESMTEGSNAHLIASDVKPSGQIRLNHEGQLMVCEEKVIKLFEYKCNPRSLQDLCRSHVQKTICSGYVDKVNSLEIPSMLKKYLLFK